MAETTEATRWVVLLRAINVGGAGRLPMAELRACLTDTGFSNVRTYIQTGNVVADLSLGHSAQQVESTVSEAIGAAFGFEPPVVALTVAQLHHVIAANPYRAEGDDDPKAVHYFFGADAPGAEARRALDELVADGEAFNVGDGVAYLHAPAGIGRSKLAVALGKRLGERTTARNHRSVLAIAELASTP
jgi:uncharacterized protein (DUF1697 family)